MTGTDKTFISAEPLLEDSFELALQIFESGFRPSVIVGVWRGGTPVGIAVQEVLDLLGCPTNHFAIRTSSYDGMNRPSREVQVFGIQNIVESAERDDSLLIIDDIFDTGRSIKAIIGTLSQACGKTMPKDIRIATVYFKPKRNTTSRVPDYYLHETDLWTVFPHELEGCSIEELKQNKPLPERIFKLLSELRDKP